MGRLEQLRINAYLSEVARGYNNNAFIAQTLFPTIYSEKEKIDIFEFKERFIFSGNIDVRIFVNVSSSIFPILSCQVLQKDNLGASLG